MEKKEPNIEYMIHLVTKFMKDKKETSNKRARNIAKNLLEDNSLTLEQRINVTSLLMTIETRLGKYKEAIMLEKSLQGTEMLPKQRQSIENKLRYVCNLENMKKNNCSKESKDNSEELKKLRDSLYEGKIDTSQIKELVEEYTKTAKGCIFIAELCKYYSLEQQGIKYINGYRSKNFTTIRKCEQKAMTQAIELLRQKTIMCPKEKWRGVYNILDKENELEEPDN